MSSTVSPPPHANGFVIGTAVINTNTQIPRWAGGWACTSHPGVLGSIPNERHQGKPGATLCQSTGFLTGPCLALGGLQIPWWLGSDPPMGWWLGLHQPPWSFGSFPKREEPRLVVSHSTCSPRSPSPPRAQLCIRHCSNKQQQPFLSSRYNSNY